MTRIKKRRSGLNKTADQKKSAAGKRRAYKAAKADAVKEQQMPKVEMTAEQKAAYKKSLQPQPAGRRNRQAVKQANGKNITGDFGKKLQENKPGVSAKPTGKTRSAGARRIAVAKSIAPGAKNTPAKKKTVPPQTEAKAGQKPAKGFAPWNKNKFRKKNKGE